MVQFLTFPVVLPMWVLLVITAMSIAVLILLLAVHARNALAVVCDVFGVGPQRHGTRHGGRHG